VRKLFRAASETILGQQTRDTHAIKASKGGPQTVRADGAAAWRRDIDDDFHLQYWAGTDGRIELSAIDTHRMTLY